MDDPHDTSLNPGPSPHGPQTLEKKKKKKKHSRLREETDRQINYSKISLPPPQRPSVSLPSVLFPLGRNSYSECTPPAARTELAPAAPGQMDGMFRRIWNVCRDLELFRIGSVEMKYRSAKLSVYGIERARQICRLKDSFYSSRRGGEKDGNLSDTILEDFVGESWYQAAIGFFTSDGDTKRAPNEVDELSTIQTDAHAYHTNPHTTILNSTPPLSKPGCEERANPFLWR
ncbi:hypothetical protein CEXT_193581 [Caerostris extrusa]|uniref:Uncharacterized protein n=1 Tax=Caerostris extrusa TaxID=172846 RepID=A0AAV4NSW9_CAEEX|nr:hypothetical protein CEXT_193581 [Caerostris extrusa]